jgi:hypothetical protein
MLRGGEDLIAHMFLRPPRAHVFAGDRVGIDFRPRAARTAEGRYREPSLLDLAGVDSTYLTIGPDGLAGLQLMDRGGDDYASVVRRSLRRGGAFFFALAAPPAWARWRR